MAQKRLVFSKQCDHDLDLIPFWYQWYKEVFQADELIVTPVKTARSTISGVLAFYGDKPVHLSPIAVDTWNEEFIWNEQKRHVAAFLPGDSQFICLSADSDQFFEPPATELPGPDLVYLRIHLISETAPHFEEIERFSAQAYLSDDHVAGYVNSLDNPRVFLTGHYTGDAGKLPRASLLREFHLTSRGIDQFAAKIKNLAVTADGTSYAGHWKRWRSALDTRGEEAIADAYRERLELASLGTRNDSLVDLFKAYAKREQHTAPATEVISPFPSRLVDIPYTISGLRGAERAVWHLPQNEVFRFEEIFSAHAYALPGGVKPPTPLRILDIGANIGLFALYAKTLDPQAEIHCFEPAPSNFKLLRSNLRRFPGIALYPYSLSATDGPTALYLHTFDSGQHSLRRTVKHHPQPITVESRSAASTFDAIGGAAFDILKISAEGCETEILRSLGDRVLQCEYIFVTYCSEENRRMLDSALTGFSLYSSTAQKVGRGLVKYVNKKARKG